MTKWTFLKVKPFQHHTSNLAPYPQELGPQITFRHDWKSVPKIRSPLSPFQDFGIEVSWFPHFLFGIFFWFPTKLRHLQQIWGPWVWVDINLLSFGLTPSFWSSPNSLWFLNPAGDVGISRIQNSPWSKEPAVRNRWSLGWHTNQDRKHSHSE